MNPPRSSPIATYAAANSSPRSPNASGIAADMIRLSSISASRSTRTGDRSGSTQFVAHAV